MSIEKFKNLPVKEMMEHFGFQGVRTYYMGSPGDEGDENKEHFAGFRNTDTGNINIPVSEIDTSYSNMIYSTGHRRIGTKYRNIDEIYLGYKDTHKGRVAIGYRTIEYHGIYKTVVGIVIRGTAEDDDWDSDFDMGDKDLRDAIQQHVTLDGKNVVAGNINISNNEIVINSYLNSGNNTKYDHQYNTELAHFAYGYPDWTHTQHHAGFDIVSNRILEVIDNYYTELSRYFDEDIEILDENTIETAITANSVSNYSNDIVDGGVCFWITGHSMGAGVANLVAANLIDNGYRDSVYCYTFAAPNTFYWSDNKEDNYREPKGVNYRCIFNIVNDDDFVSKLPMEACEWTKYGRTGNVSIEARIKNTIRSNKTYYQYIKDNYKSYKAAIGIVVLALSEMYDNKFEMRSESYSYDNKVGKAEIIYKPEENLVDDILYYSEYTKPYQRYVYNNGYIQNQMPAYLMMSIANSMHSNIKDKELNGKYRKQLKNKRFYVTDVWENQYILLTAKFGFNSWGAKWGLVATSAFDIVEKPHYLESYYSLTKELSTTDFE